MRDAEPAWSRGSPSPAADYGFWPLRILLEAGEAALGLLCEIGVIVTYAWWRGPWPVAPGLADWHAMCPWQPGMSRPRISITWRRSADGEGEYGMPFTGSDVTHLLATYGYWAVLLVVALESTGIPLPGETMLVAAAIYAGTTHQLSIQWVIAAAAAGAILGDNLGFWVGHEGGYRLLRRFGHVIRLHDRRLKLGQYLFLRHGGKVVFFGRFVAVLRAWAAFLAGTNRMPWPRFLFFNATGGILWATVYGLAGYVLGSNIDRIRGPFAIATLVAAVIALITFFIFVRRNEERLEDEAERALPGPIDTYSVERERARK